MNKDGVVAAFELIIEEIESVAQEIAEQGGDAFKQKNYEQAKNLGESGKNLESFRSKVSLLLEEWQAGIDVMTRQRFVIDRKKSQKTNLESHSRSPKTRLKVTTADGTVIEDYFAADTFALAIKNIGIDRVKSLGLKESGIPLIDSYKSNAYTQRMIDGWYICTHSNTQKKKETLEKIASDLKSHIKVEII